MLGGEGFEDVLEIGAGLGGELIVALEIVGVEGGGINWGGDAGLDADFLVNPFDAEDLDLGWGVLVDELLEGDGGGGGVNAFAVIEVEGFGEGGVGDGLAGLLSVGFEGVKDGGDKVGEVGGLEGFVSVAGFAVAISLNAGALRRIAIPWLWFDRLWPPNSPYCRGTAKMVRILMIDEALEPLNSVRYAPLTAPYANASF